jgi:hypothetical protein
MRKITYCLLALFSISCVQKRNSETLSPKDTTLVIDSRIEAKDTMSRTAEDNCVFNEDYKGLTTEWLKELGIEDFIWRDDLEQALIPKEQDTVFVSQGGCTHFSFLVEIKLTDDQHLLNDSSFFVQEALTLAREFKMEHYEKMINEGRLRKMQDQETSVWYEIDDDNMEDNLTYTGIEIKKEGEAKRVNISQYFN